MSPISTPTTDVRGSRRSLATAARNDAAAAEAEVWLGVPAEGAGAAGHGQDRHGSPRTVGGVPVFGTPHGPRLLELID